MKEKGSRYTKRKARMESKIMGVYGGNWMDNERKADVYWQIFPRDSDTGLCAESCFNQTLLLCYWLTLPRHHIIVYFLSLSRQSERTTRHSSNIPTPPPTGHSISSHFFPHPIFSKHKEVMKPWPCTPVVTLSDTRDSCPYVPPSELGMLGDVGCQVTLWARWDGTSRHVAWAFTKHTHQITWKTRRCINIHAIEYIYII